LSEVEDLIKTQKTLRSKLHLPLKSSKGFVRQEEEKRLKAAFNPITQCFSTFFGSRHPVRLKKNWRHPYLAKMTIWGTLSSKKTLKVSKFNIWLHP